MTRITRTSLRKRSILMRLSAKGKFVLMLSKSMTSSKTCRVTTMRSRMFQTRAGPIKNLQPSETMRMSSSVTKKNAKTSSMILKAAGTVSSKFLAMWSVCMPMVAAFAITKQRTRYSKTMLCTILWQSVAQPPQRPCRKMLLPSKFTLDCAKREDCTVERELQPACLPAGSDSSASSSKLCVCKVSVGTTWSGRRSSPMMETPEEEYPELLL
mmetsp:Transcript_149704/g.417273  ORF Transcript_149704/g.417273 Transcript_149704/m.417273 type:complete len:212 (-) Transcript_149704:628-1263(-)